MNTENARKIAEAVVALHAHRHQEAHRGDTLHLMLYALIDETRPEEDRHGGLIVLIVEHDRIGRLAWDGIRGVGRWTDEQCEQALACYARTVQPTATITTPDQLREGARAFAESFDALLGNNERITAYTTQLQSPL